MSIANEEETTADAPSSDAKTKQQKKEEGRRRALEIARAKQDRAPGRDATAGHANANRAHRKSARHGARNQNRHKQFAKWLLARFPRALAECGAESADGVGRRHVLDVAGGKGELAARLSLCHGLRVLMIDPRPADIQSVYMNSVVPKLPKKWQASVRARLQQSPTFVHDELETRFSQLVEPFAAPPCCTGTLAEEPEGSGRYREDRVDAAVREAALLVGLHADGATEAIVEAALLYRTPFVVVPCCVFPNLFRARYVWEDAVVDGGDGAPVRRRVHVRNHDQFCRYLLEKDPRFVMEVLPFEGRNVAIWWDGK